MLAGKLREAMIFSRYDLQRASFHTVQSLSGSSMGRLRDPSGASAAVEARWVDCVTGPSLPLPLENRLSCKSVPQSQP
jgi:hypothetical protein